MFYFVSYNYGSEFKKDKDLGVSKCENCNHEAEKILLTEKYKVKLFNLIPIFSKVKNRGIFCSHCGNIKNLSKKEYEDMKKQI